MIGVKARNGMFYMLCILEYEFFAEVVVLRVAGDSSQGLLYPTNAFASVNCFWWD